MTEKESLYYIILGIIIQHEEQNGEDEDIKKLKDFVYKELKNIT